MSYNSNKSFLNSCNRNSASSFQNCCCLLIGSSSALNILDSQRYPCLSFESDLKNSYCAVPKLQIFPSKSSCARKNVAPYVRIAFLCNCAELSALAYVLFSLTADELIDKNSFARLHHN